MYALRNLFLSLCHGIIIEVWNPFKILTVLECPVKHWNTYVQLTLVTTTAFVPKDVSIKMNLPL